MTERDREVRRAKNRNSSLIDEYIVRVYKETGYSILRKEIRVNEILSFLEILSNYACNQSNIYVNSR